MNTCSNCKSSDMQLVDCSKNYEVIPASASDKFAVWESWECEDCNYIFTITDGVTTVDAQFALLPEHFYIGV